MRNTPSGVHTDREGKVSDFVDSDQRGLDTSRMGRKVSYYFTNILECLPIFLRRKKLEVFGILTDVFIARQRNA